jgi:hypothetical protein
MPENYFGERHAERYDERHDDMFDPAVVDPVVDFLAAPPARGPLSNSASARVGSHYRSHSAAYVCTGSTCRRRWSQG